MTTMIALIGEQTLPNYLPIQHYQPDNVICLYTERTQKHYARLKAVCQKISAVDGIEVDPYDISAIATVLRDELAENVTLSAQPLLFNLTGGTKAMILAAYQVAQQYNAPVIYLQSEGEQSIIDSYSWQDNHLVYQSKVLVPEYLTLTKALDLHLGQGKDEKGNDIWHETGFVKRTDGTLFELAIAYALRDHGYEVKCGVKDTKGQVDIDVMIRDQNQIGVIEAKTEKDGAKQFGKTDGAKQLSNTMRYLRGTYTKPFLVINAEPSENLQWVCSIVHVKIISLPHYQKEEKALTPEDTNTLLTEIGSVMKRK